jgi:hypothetical protein
MRIPYTEVGPGIYRPLVAVRVWGLDGPYLEDGLLDTGADRTLLTTEVAEKVGIDLAALSSQILIRSATLQRVTCPLTGVVLALQRDSERYCWRAEVAVATQPIRVSHWGSKGYLEFFRATFDGPRRFASLVAGHNLPSALPPG